MMKELTHKMPAKTMFEFIKEFRKIDSEMQAQTIQTFLVVAMDVKNSFQMTELSERLGISQASCSRNVSAFLNTNRKRKKGPGFLITKEDPEERRRKIVSLTPKGKSFYKDLENIWIGN